MGSDFYFASERDPARLTQQIAARIQETNDGRSHADWGNAYEHLYGSSLRLGSQSTVVRDGKLGELTKIRVNKAKALLKSIVGLILGAPMTWRASARNSDVEARAVVLKASNLLEFFWKQNGLGTFCGEWVEYGLAFGDCYAYPEWAPGLGMPAGVDYSVGGGQLLFGGGLRIRTVMPWDVFYDSDYRSWEELPWVCIRTMEPKHRLIALNPALKEQIANAGAEWLKSAGTQERHRKGDKDAVPVYTFWHKDVPECPGGLEVKFLSADVCLSAKACKEIPLERFAPGTRADSVSGDSQWQSVLGLQQLVDGVHSALASNLMAFGVQAVAHSAGTGVDRDNVNNLLSFTVKQGEDLPVALQLVKQPEGADKMLEMWDSAMTAIVGQNDVSMGSPKTAQMNAEAFALLASKAHEQLGGTQRRALDAIGKLGGRVIRLLADNMPEDKAVSIAGKSSRTAYPMQGATAATLKGVESVFVDVGNALEQSASGRLAIYEKIAEGNPNLTAEEKQQIIETGRLEQAVNVERDESLFIEWENEQILQGITPVVDFSEDHMKHAKKHRVTTLTPAARSDPKVIAAQDQHFHMHLASWLGLPPGADPRGDPRYPDAVAVILGRPALSMLLPPPVMPGMPSPAGGAPPPSGPPSDSSEGSPPALSPPQDGEQQLPTVIPESGAVA